MAAAIGLRRSAAHRFSPGGYGRHLTYQRVVASGPIGYWPMDDAPGASVAADHSGNGRDLTVSASGVTFGVSGMGDGRTAARFDGSAGTMTGPAGLVSAANGSEGAFGCWMKADEWAGARRLFSIWYDTNNRIDAAIPATTNSFRFWYTRSGTSTLVSFGSRVSLGWRFVWMCWSMSYGGVMKSAAGMQTGYNTLGQPASAIPAPTSVTVGYSNLSATSYWKGGMAHLAVWDRRVGPGEMMYLYGRV